MSTDLAGKRVLVLSDNRGLSRVIQLALEKNDLKVAKSVLGSRDRIRGQGGVGGVDLIIIAASSPSSEPMAVLVKASTVEQVGQVPHLVISGNPCDPDLDGRIAYLGFPFDIDELCGKVQEILQGES